MPRTNIVVQEVAQKYPVLPVAANSIDFTFSVGDAVNGLEYVATGREVVIMRNVNVGAQTFTLKSVKDELNRTGDITNYSLGPNEFAVLVPPLKGFQNPDGKVYIDVAHNDVNIAVLRVPVMT
jgi:hypothetical protein